MKNLYSVAFLIFLIQMAYSGKITQPILNKYSKIKSNSELIDSDSSSDSKLNETVDVIPNQSQELKENSLKKLIAAKKNGFLNQVQKNVLDNLISKNQDNNFKNEINNHINKLLKMRESNQAKCEKNSIFCRSQLFNPNTNSKEEGKSVDQDEQKKEEEPQKNFLKNLKKGNLKKTKDIIASLQSAPISKKN